MIEECSKYKHNQTIVLVIPLLFEAKFEDICTEIWLVKCPKELQKKRLIARDKISEKEAYDSINLQLSFEEKSKFTPWFDINITVWIYLHFWSLRLNIISSISCSNTGFYQRII